MFERYTDRTRRVVTLTAIEAQEMRHGTAGTGHLLVALLREGGGVAFQALTALGITEETARSEVLKRTPAGQVTPGGHMPFSPRMRKVLELALRESIQLGCNYIATEHLLLALVREGDGTAAKALAGLGYSPGMIQEKVTGLLASSTDAPVPVPVAPQPAAGSAHVAAGCVTLAGEAREVVSVDRGFLVAALRDAVQLGADAARVADYEAALAAIGESASC